MSIVEQQVREVIKRFWGNRTIEEVEWFGFKADIDQAMCYEISACYCEHDREKTVHFQVCLNEFRVREAFDSMNSGIWQSFELDGII